MEEAGKEYPVAGGDPGASLLQKKLVAKIAPLNKSRTTLARSSLKKYQSRPLRTSKRAVSLDDLPRRVEDSRRRRAFLLGHGGSAAAAVGRGRGTRGVLRRPPPPSGPRRPALAHALARPAEEEEGVETAEEGRAVCSRCDVEGQRELRAGRRILGALVLHAWRRRRADLSAALAAAAEAATRTEGMSLQARVLRQLLEAERERLQDFKDEALAQRAHHLQEREALVVAGQRAVEEVEGQLQTAQAEVTALRAQVEAEHSHTDAMRRQLHQALMQVEALGTAAKTAVARAEVLETRMEELKAELQVQEQLRCASDTERQDACLKLLEMEAETQRLKSLEVQLQENKQAQEKLKEALACERAEIVRLQMQLRSCDWWQSALHLARSLALGLPLALLQLGLPFTHSGPLAL